LRHILQVECEACTGRLKSIVKSTIHDIHH